MPERPGIDMIPEGNRFSMVSGRMADPSQEGLLIQGKNQTIIQFFAIAPERTIIAASDAVQPGKSSNRTRSST